MHKCVKPFPSHHTCTCVCICVCLCICVHFCVYLCYAHFLKLLQIKEDLVPKLYFFKEFDYVVLTLYVLIVRIWLPFYTPLATNNICCQINHVFQMVWRLVSGNLNTIFASICAYLLLLLVWYVVLFFLIHFSQFNMANLILLSTLFHFIPFYSTFTFSTLFHFPILHLPLIPLSPPTHPNGLQQ